jgi:hypothetical protein
MSGILPCESPVDTARQLLSGTIRPRQVLRKRVESLVALTIIGLHNRRAVVVIYGVVP